MYANYHTWLEQAKCTCIKTEEIGSVLKVVKRFHLFCSKFILVRTCYMYAKTYVLRLSASTITNLGTTRLVQSVSSALRGVMQNARVHDFVIVRLCRQHQRQQQSICAVVSCCQGRRHLGLFLSRPSLLLFKYKYRYFYCCILQWTCCIYGVSAGGFPEMSLNLKASTTITTNCLPIRYT